MPRGGGGLPCKKDRHGYQKFWEELVEIPRSCHSFYCQNGMTTKAQVVDLWRLNTRGTWTLYKVQWAPHYVYGSHPWGFMSSIFSTIIAFPNIYTFHLLLFSSRHNDFICSPHSLNFIRFFPLPAPPVGVKGRNGWNSDYSPHWNIWVLICNLLQELQFQRIYITSHKGLEFPQGWEGEFVIPKV